MRYIHYGCASFDKSKFQEIKNEPCFCKPKGGLWASPVDAEYGWKDWCEAENFRECSQDNSFSFALKDGAKVYHIHSVQDVKAMPQVNTGITTFYIPDFEKMLADGWDAIELHMSECGALYWALYGWDCDCILIMNRDVIEYRTPPQGGRRRPEGHIPKWSVALFLFGRGFVKFCFGDIVVVDGNQIGVIVKSWCKSLQGNPESHDVYVRSYNKIVNYREDKIERYMVRHKYLDEEEMMWQKNAIEGR